MKKQEAIVDPGTIEAEENFLIDCQFLIQDLINLKGISRSELAKRAGISKSRLSQILSAEANPTVKTFARLFHVLGVAVTPRVVQGNRDNAASLLPDQDGWELVEEEVSQLLLSKSERANADSWLGASNDNYGAVDGNVESIQLRVA